MVAASDLYSVNDKLKMKKSDIRENSMDIIWLNAISIINLNYYFSPV